MNDNNQHFSILVIDDHPLLRRGIHNLTGMDEQFYVAAEAASGEQGIELALELDPDLILLDLNMSGMDGLQTLKKLREHNIRGQVVILTVSDQQKDIVACLQEGADGYLLKDMEPEDMLQRLHKVMQGHVVLSEKVSDIMARGLHKQAAMTATKTEELTEREEEILQLIAKGYSNKHIARELDIVEGTVKVHVKHLLRKLNLRSRVEAAVWVVENKAGS